MSNTTVKKWVHPKPEVMDRLVWDAVYDKATLDPAYGDEEYAKAAADEAVELIKSGRKAQTQNAWIDFLCWIGGGLARIGKWLAAIALVCAVFGSIAFGVNYWVTSYDDNYAGLDPSSVQNFAGEAIYQWYGQDNPPPDMSFWYKQHSLLAGKKAWLTVFRTKSGSLVCAFNWKSDSSDDAGHKVFQGNDCR